MKILLLNLYYPPDTSATAKMAETVVQALAERHDVTVLCGRPSYDPAERRDWQIWHTERSGRVTVIRVGSTDFPRFSMKKRLANYLSYTALAILRAPPIRCDAVLAMTDPPFEGIVGALIALLKGKPYVYNIRDMYPDMAVGGSIVKPGLVTRAWERVHLWALRRAAKVVVLGEDMRRRVVAKGLDDSRIEIVRDGVLISRTAVTPLAFDREVIRAIRGDFRFVLLHAGNLGFYGSWDTLLTAARDLEKEGIGFVFVGDGAERKRLESAAAKLSNVRFLPFFPTDKISSVLAAADVHVVTVRNGLEGVVIPSKLYGILEAGKPILAVTPRACEPVILGEQYGFARYASADDPRLVVQVALQLFRDPDDLRRMGEAAKMAAPAYDRVKELQKFVQIVAGLTGAGNSKEAP